MNLTKSKLHVAVLTALPLMVMTSYNANAAGVCADFIGTATSGAVVSGKSCTGGDATLINASGTTIGVTNASAAGNSVWIEGVGNVVTNNGTIQRTSSSGNTIGVLLGDYTVSRFSASGSTGAAATADGVTATTPATGSGKNLSLVGTGSYANYGTATNNQLILSKADLTTAGITNSAQLVGKTIKMNGVVVDGEARAGESRIITAYNPTTGIITVNRPWTTTQAGKGYNVIAGSGDNEFTNNGTIAANSTATGSANVRAIDTNVAGNYLITNTGNINASHTSIGAAQGIDVGGDVTEMTIVNSGNITATRNEAITLVTNSATALTATSASTTTATNVGAAAAIYSQEEAEYISVTNTANGTITGVGKYNPALYLRAAEQIVNNAGVINGSRQGSVGSYTYGMAIGSVSDSNEVRTLDLTNSGTINGDVLAVNGNAYRWSAITTEGTLDNRLLITSNQGVLDSTISNTGTINGSLFFSNGTHQLSNANGASITGNIDLDQRPTYATSTTTNPGGKSFTFENAGTFNGNIKVYTATGSDATLRPTINGAGTSTPTSPNTSNIKLFNGALQIISTTASGGDVGNVTISPVIASGTMVTDGQYYKVANSVSTGTTSSLTALTSTATSTQLPSGGDNGLLSWTPSINASGALVVQAEVDADNVAGASSAAKSALTSLMAFNSELGNAVQNLATNEEVRKAGEQLRPEANNAAYQSVVALTNRVSSLIGLHQDQVRSGATGVSSGEAADGAGFWLEAYGFRGDQKTRGNVDGYQADTGGFVIGGDKTVGNGDGRFGAAFAYGSTGISGEGATTANRTDIDSYQGILYGSYNAGAWYADASLGYGRHQFDTRRVVSLAGASLTGNHNANQYSAKLGFGLPVTKGIATFTPLATLSYVQLDQNAYSESDRNDTGAALSVNSTKTESFRSGLGAKISVALATTELSPTLEARAVWNHEFGDTNQNITARFDDGTNSFITNGVSQPRDSANLGMGINLKSKTGQTLSVNYDAEVRNDYVSHTAGLKARFDF